MTRRQQPSPPEHASKSVERARGIVRGRSDPWTDLGLTLPIFIGYHLGVPFLNVRNAADFVTAELTALAKYSLLAYTGLTVSIGLVMLAVLVILGRGSKLNLGRFVLVIAEGSVYAASIALVASYVVGTLHLGPPNAKPGFFAATIMSFGAGFYEEVAFRVVLFGLGARLLCAILPAFGRLVPLAWAIFTAVVFSAWHYVGPLGDAFTLASFVFRAVCGICFVLIYRLRGFAPVVWTHALYDVWVLNS